MDERRKKIIKEVKAHFIKQYPQLEDKQFRVSLKQSTKMILVKDMLALAGTMLTL